MRKTRHYGTLVISSAYNKLDIALLRGYLIIFAKAVYYRKLTHSFE